MTQFVGGYKLLWQIVAVFVLLNHGLSRVAVRDGVTRATWSYYLFPIPDERLNDFFQEWASARNWHTGMPVYSHHAESIPAHLGLNADQVTFAYNAHPPTSVLLALPLGKGTLHQALGVWHVLNLMGLALSAWLVTREWGVRGTAAWGWWVLPGLALALSLKPVEEQFAQGQMNGILLPLLVAAWVAWRRGYWGWSGGLIGLATTLKIFPVFFVLFFVLRRQPRGVLTSILTVGGVTLVTAGILGFDAYHDYFKNVLPSLSKFRPARTNESLVGCWHRLFTENHYDGVQPWVVAPVAAWLLTSLSALVLVACTAWRVYYAATHEALDRSYWLLATAMLLLGPLTWPHSALLLSVGLAYLVRDVRPTMPPHNGQDWLLLGLFASFLVRPAVLFAQHGWMPDPVPPWASVAICSIPLAVNLVLFAWQCHFVRRADQQASLA